MADVVQQNLPPYFHVGGGEAELHITRSDEKQESARWALEAILEGLQDGCKVTGVAPIDAAVTIVDKYEARRGIFQRIWDCILQCLGFITDLEELCALREEIRDIAIGDGGYPLTFFSQKLNKVADFLFRLSPDELLPLFTQEGLPTEDGSLPYLSMVDGERGPFNADQLTAQECYDSAKRIFPYFACYYEKWCESNPRTSDAHEETALCISLREIALVLVELDLKKEHLEMASYAIVLSERGSDDITPEAVKIASLCAQHGCSYYAAALLRSIPEKEERDKVINAVLADKEHLNQEVMKELLEAAVDLADRPTFEALFKLCQEHDQVIQKHVLAWTTETSDADQLGQVFDSAAAHRLWPADLNPLQVNKQLSEIEAGRLRKEIEALQSQIEKYLYNRVVARIGRSLVIIQATIRAQQLSDPHLSTIEVLLAYYPFLKDELPYMYPEWQEKQESLKVLEKSISDFAQGALFHDGLEQYVAKMAAEDESSDDEE